MEDRAQDGKVTDKDVRKVERVHRNSRKNEELPNAGVWGLELNHKSTWITHISAQYSTYFNENPPIFAGDDFTLRLAPRAPPFAFSFLTACPPGIFRIFHTFLCPRLDTFEMESVPT